MMEIVTTDNPILLKKAEEVTKFGRKFHELVRNMEETLLATTDPKGVGLAAPQVGVSLRVFLVKPKDKSRVQAYVNPILEFISPDENDDIPQSKRIQAAQASKKLPKKRKLLEGCLSIPNIWGYVSRKKEVILSYQDLHGNHHQKHLKGFPAVITQHETDHLNGILFTKHVLEQGEQLYRSYKNEKGEDEFEELKI